LKVRHPVEGLTFTFPVVEGEGGRRMLGGAFRQKGVVARRSAAHHASQARASAEREARKAGLID
jgi:hypothetical protein